jgi:hypothetical protein
MPYAPVDPYITLTELRQELKMKAADVPAASDTEEDLLRAIDNASRWVDNYCQRDFLFHDYTATPLEFDQFNGFDCFIFPPYTPIISVTSLVFAGTALVLGTHYSVENQLPQRQRVNNLCGAWKPRRPDRLLQLYGTFGYVQSSHAVPPTGLPGSVTLATRWVAAAISGRNRKEVVGLDGIKQTLEDSAIGKQVYALLGKRSPILMM